MEFFLLHMHKIVKISLHNFFFFTHSASDKWNISKETITVSRPDDPIDFIYKIYSILLHMLLEYDVTRRDPLTVVMDAGSRIVNFIRDSTVFA